MRLIDMDVFIAEMNSRIEEAIKWRTNAIADGNEEIKMRAEQAVATFCEASLTAKKMPTIKAEPRWIPVTERLPEDVGYGEEYPLVIFCTDKRSYVGFYEYFKGGQWWNYTADGDYIVGGVIAWMPLPKPYSEVEREKSDG